MNILLIGRGRMGTLIRQTAQAGGDTVVDALGHEDLGRLAELGKVADVAVDFSSPAALSGVVDYVKRTATPYLSGVTGLSESQMELLRSVGQTAPVLWSANFSLGIAVFCRILSQVSDTLRPDFDVEIVETHHNQKADAPSGTAKLLLRSLDPRGELTPVYGREGLCGPRREQEIGVHAIRGGTVAGTHTVHFFGTDEELEITHRAASRQIFASGAYHVARLLPAMPAGVYDLQDILFRK